ncbi:MAG: chemotaxis protein CheD [Syntrophobacteraceae bacterium]|nr:chemotaxis protein CheD [Desulfobacteraceae bacterium]
MIAEYKKNYRYVTLFPGEYYASGQNVAISTVLGSCVSACLYDPVNCIVGMNHFLLSYRNRASSTRMLYTRAGSYGVHSMELLINRMLRLGADRENLRAKAFGGASVLKAVYGHDSFYRVGEVNARFIRDFLANEGIPLIAADLGGDRARLIHFSADDDFGVYVRKNRIRDHSRLIQEERKHWKKRVEAQEETAPQVDLWL